MAVSTIAPFPRDHPDMDQTSLPRVTYSNIGVDFAPVHAHLDRAIPAFALGAFHPNRIGGRDDDGGHRHPTFGPIDDRLKLGEFVAADAAAVDRAVVAARKAAGEWGRRPWASRVDAIRAVATKIERRKFDLGIACLIEVGKSRLEAMGEAEETVDLLRYYADEMAANGGYARDMARAFLRETTRLVLRPHGVFAVIAPFNFPLALSAGMMAGALLGGNAVVFKPGPRSGLTGAMLTACFEAILPPGVVNMVGGEAAGPELASHTGIDGIAFTGSHAVGMELLRGQAARTHMRPVIVEMGGKNPVHVTATADLDVAAEGTMRSAFGLTGQKCSACSVAFVERSVHDAFLAKLIEKTRALKIGDPRGRDVFVGPAIDADAGARHAGAVAAAKRDGKLVHGGARLAGGVLDRGVYVEPAIATGLPYEHRLNREELFVPFLSVMAVDDLARGIALANKVEYGLTAGIYARDTNELDLFFESAEAGVLYANRRSGATTGAWPGIQTFCGWKGSGVTGKGGLGPWYVPQFMREQSRTSMA
jgi:1-pyrroline-5-carboxylate dehydrogenase